MVICAVRVGRKSKQTSLREQILTHLADRATESRFPLTPRRIVHDVRQVMPDDGIVCLDNGLYKIWFARNYRTRVANTLLLDNALATMGAGLPSAIMAAMLFPQRRVGSVSSPGISKGPRTKQLRSSRLRRTGSTPTVLDQRHTRPRSGSAVCAQWSTPPRCLRPPLLTHESRLTASLYTKKETQKAFAAGNVQSHIPKGPSRL